ncbi:NeuD/PglB/VioB family sugar acetyltransferase [Roseovarius nanhaiticus]|uniref:NeuD/PglB/VioB family sugar acetyltransferase n=1 Tax=Roseovarius nanhaiticus TaxID=573024 RepID=UPI00249057BC|nr:NeuD/PglB/VioB family sugar acetyltransferase [Roseovarius nanhaiticus]
MSDRICLFGAGGHGRVIAAQIKAKTPRIDICFGDGNTPLGTLVNGYPVAFQTPHSVTGAQLIVAIGDNAIRAKLQGSAEDAGIQITHFIAEPYRYFAADPGAGSVVLAGAVVTCDVQIGKGAIVNSGAVVEHDSVLGDFCHIASGAVLSGGSRLGDRVFVGSGAQIINQSRIVAGAVIGAGATVVRDITEPGIYVGTPARLLRNLPGAGIAGSTP